MEKWFHPTLHTGCNYLSTTGLKLIHVSKRGNWWSNPLDINTGCVNNKYLCKTFPHLAIKVQCFLTTINLNFKFQLMVHEKLSWRNCKCLVDLWQPGQIVLKKCHPSKNLESVVSISLYMQPANNNVEAQWIIIIYKTNWLVSTSTSQWLRPFFLYFL